ncbi:MAG: TonB-dependent receptor [Acidobacteria bacterium]|nr:TonB-dependent receptor [Acidobacteriota bacterium]
MRRACLYGAAIAAIGLSAGTLHAQGQAAPQPAQKPAAESDREKPAPPPPAQDASTFRLGEIVHVLGTELGTPGVGGEVLTHDQIWTYERNSIDQAVNLVPGVVSTFDANGRRNESDIFVRGFGRWQVPLMIDGVRIYLPADNRLDFARFLTADVAAIQIQKGYASVLDGPGAMGGAINLVTAKPSRAFEGEGGVSAGGRDVEGWNAYATVGTRQRRYYLQSGVAVSDRDSWSLSHDYRPTATSLQPAGARIGSDSRDWRVNVKAAYTPTAANEYAINYTRQAGEKGAPLNVYNNPPVPPNSYWRWPQWDVQTVALLTTTQLTGTSYVKAKAYYNIFQNVLDAFDDVTYTTQSAAGRFRSTYDDHAYGTSIEFGATAAAINTLKAAVHYRTDVHGEDQTSRPTHPTLASAEPVQEQAQNTWSVAFEDTVRVSKTVDLTAGVSYDRYDVTKAEDFNAARGIFTYPLGGSDALNWQAAVVWRHAPSGEWHASVSDRARFPMLFELYSTRFGTATPNPDLGPERATNVELGWSRTFGGARLSATGFYSDVRDLIQTVVLADTTTQTQNVGTGDFRGIELSAEAPVGTVLRIGGHYTAIRRVVRDALQPNLRPTGVPGNRAFVYASWQPVAALRFTPSVEAADDRWSDVNPAPAFPYVKTGAHTLANLDVTYALPSGVEISGGFKNLLDDYYELAWGYPQPGRTFYLRTRVRF